MTYIELRFPVIGSVLTSDCGRAMFQAITRLIPELCGADWIGIDSIVRDQMSDVQSPRSKVQSLTGVSPRARLSMRVPQSRVPLMLKLSGKHIDVGGQVVRLCAPQVFLLKPASHLYSRCVLIKNRALPGAFLDAVALRLDRMGVRGEPELGPRRVFRRGRRRIVGFALKIHDLSEDGSIALQEQGLGSGRHIGCGFFVPVRKSFMKRQKDYVYIE